MGCKELAEKQFESILAREIIVRMRNSQVKLCSIVIPGVSSITAFLASLAGRHRRSGSEVRHLGGNRAAISPELPR